VRLSPRERWIGFVTTAVASLYVWFTLQPDLLLSNTTANGGDTGAHVWWPAFLRDHILPKWRLTGWAPDWSPDAVAQRRTQLDGFDGRWQALHEQATSWPVAEQVDYRLIGSALARVHFELNVICIHERNPGFYVDQTLGLLFLSLLRPPPFTEARSRAIVRALPVN